MLDAYDLKNRGWTDHLIRRFRPLPDDWGPQRHNLYHAPHLWQLDTIVRIEAAPAFQRALRRTRRFKTECVAYRETAADKLARLAGNLQADPCASALKACPMPI